jgi:hypothetical protein
MGALDPLPTLARSKGCRPSSDMRSTQRKVQVVPALGQAAKNMGLLSRFWRPAAITILPVAGFVVEQRLAHLLSEISHPILYTL